MKDFAKSIRTGNSYGWREKNGHQELYNPNVPFGGHTRGYVEKGKNGYIGAKTNGSIVISKKEFASEEEAKKYVENSKVGNGSGDWHGRIYEDRAGNSATVEKRGDGWEVYWEDSRGYGKPLGTYKDEKTARDVAEAAVETEMPDKIRGNYRSKAINQKVGNLNKVSDAKGLYEDFRDAEKSGDTAKIERYKSKAKERIRDLQAKLKEIQEDEKDVSSALQIYYLMV